MDDLEIKKELREVIHKIDHTVHASIYMKRPEQADLERQTRLVVTRGGGRWKQEVVANEYRVSFQCDEDVVKFDQGDSCTTENTLKAIEVHTWVNCVV